MTTELKRTKLIIVLALIFSFTTFAQVKLPKLVSDGMILQREIELNIWGWASEGEKITIIFLDSEYSTVTDDKGNWNILLPKYDAGGPYEMTITASNIISIKDILIGDVWICSGQSNMEIPIKRVSWNYPGEIENSENNYIRQFYVPRKYNFIEPQKDVLDGTWESASKENTPDFSATAYFFGKELYEKFGVPVGLINTSLGGSPVESWISEDSLKRFPKYFNESEMYKDNLLIQEVVEVDNARREAWYKLLRKTDKGFQDNNNNWIDPNLDDCSWAKMQVPGYWADTDLGLVNGVVWFRKKVNIPSSMVGKSAKLILGRIVDADSAFINGKFVGTISYQYPPSRFDIPTDLLKEGENSIVVRVINNSGKGGFVLDKNYVIETKDTSINLAGEWKFKLGSEMPPMMGQTFIRWKPIGLFNSMISPLLNYKIKGALWYQGESNTSRANEYHELLSLMISDWRSRWNIGSFPFLFVQLPNFMEPKAQPSESDWALLREAQLKTLSVPNTAMVVGIDLGEWNDIHPLNKEDIGKRLFLAAEKAAYGNDKIPYSGPLYKSMQIEENKIILTFDHIYDGLISKDSKSLSGFAIAGKDKKFIWAKAIIENNKVIVWCDEIGNPIAVRYAWADNPENANLYNSAGLPASPFRTDEY